MTDRASPLSPEQLRAVEAARRRRRSLNVAAGVAAFNGWSTAACALLSLLLAAFTPWALVPAAVLGGLAAAELYGRALLRRLDPRGLSFLALNQTAFLVVITLYSVWQIVAAFTGRSEAGAVLANDPAIAELGIDIEGLTRLLAVAIYGGVILLSVIFNGGCALYYLSRRKHLAAYLSETPAWVRELEQR